MASLLRQHLALRSLIYPSPSGSTAISHRTTWALSTVGAQICSLFFHTWLPFLSISLALPMSPLCCWPHSQAVFLLYSAPTPPASPKSPKESDIHLGLVAMRSYLLWVQERYSSPPSPPCTHPSTGNRLPNSHQFLGKRREFCDEQSGSIWLKCLKSPVHG